MTLRLLKLTEIQYHNLISILNYKFSDDNVLFPKKIAVLERSYHKYKLVCIDKATLDSIWDKLMILYDYCSPPSRSPNLIREEIEELCERTESFYSLLRALQSAVTILLDEDILENNTYLRNVCD